MRTSGKGRGNTLTPQIFKPTIMRKIMTEKKMFTKISMTNTKQEMLKAYNALLKEMEEREKAELKPEKRLEEKEANQVEQMADSLSSEGVAREISNLKIEIGKMLARISDGLEQEVNKYRDINKAIEVKEKEFRELYEIEHSASTLAALIEAQSQKRQEFESEMARRKDELDQEIRTVSVRWEKEKKEHDARVREENAEEKKRREREREEFDYGFEREQQLARDAFEDEKADLEKEIQTRKEELTRREETIAEKENELNELRARAAAHPKEMEAAVNKATKEATDRINLGAKTREELMKKDFDGQRNVFLTQIDSFEKTVKEQCNQISKLSQQLEKAYQKVQDIALKAVDVPSSVKSLDSLQQFMTEQTRKQSQER
jgi:chromosome segregation ATPase